MALLKRDEAREKWIQTVSLKVVMVNGKAKLYVTCSCAWSFARSPNPTDKGEIFFSFSPLFYKMTPDDESDPFHGEVSSWWNFRDETFIFTIHAFLIIFEKKTFC